MYIYIYIYIVIFLQKANKIEVYSLFKTLKLAKTKIIEIAISPQVGSSQF